MDSLLCEGIRLGASDLHLEPHAHQLLIRCRVDGFLRDLSFISPQMHKPIVSRIKVMASLDIGERRLPQDGRIQLQCVDQEQTRPIDLRVSTLPTLRGERLVLRLLDQLRAPSSLTELGMGAWSSGCFERALKRPHGLILATGPTGSGKSSTLYSCLHRLNRREVNIVTAEDPVELSLPDITQLQVREKIGLTFSAALRSFLRQDPDIMMIGEIRDRETAEMSIRAALTGHLVLSTLHTNDAPSSATRLIDMGIEPYLVSGAVSLICAQRLLRRLCRNCKKKTVLSQPLLKELGLTQGVARTATLFRAVGCQQCENTGYSGRVGIFEVMEMTPIVRRLVQDRAPSRDLRRAARRSGMLSLRESAVETLQLGITSVDELLRCTSAAETAWGGQTRNPKHEARNRTP